jgi:hypothetical protein
MIVVPPKLICEQIYLISLTVATFRECNLSDLLTPGISNQLILANKVSGQLIQVNKVSDQFIPNHFNLEK